MTTEAFISNRLVLGGNLVCPVRVMYREYEAYCKVWGFPIDEGFDFVQALLREPGVSVVKRGHGRLKRCFEGIGFAQQTEERIA